MPRSATVRDNQAAPVRKRLITVDAAAEYLGIGPRTVRRYIAIGRLTAYRIGDKLIRVDQAECDNLIRVVPTPGQDGVA